MKELRLSYDELFYLRQVLEDALDDPMPPSKRTALERVLEKVNTLRKQPNA